MTFRIRTSLVTALCAMSLVACASAKTTEGQDEASQASAPKLASTQTLDLSSVPLNSVVRVEVMVDAAGHADVSTLSVTGLAGNLTKEVVERWVQSAQFTPAQLNGKPVPGLYKGEFKRRPASRARG